MTLAVDIEHRQGAFLLDVRVETGRGLVALFGRSGSGKTTLINIIAGLIRPDRGSVSIDGATLVDTARSIFVPPHKRRIGYVFQEGRLFPHLTVRQNLLYGRWFAGDATPQDELASVVDLLGIGGIMDRRPARLSGGEKQRVAIGRALLASPRLLLMDEPLASLDAERKAEILPYIERLRDHAKVPIVYVSHSISEVVRLASTIVLMDNGRVAAAGPTAQIMQRIDLFPLTGRADAGAVVDAVVEHHDEASGLTELRSAAGLWRLPRLSVPVRTPVRLRVRARDVILAKTAPSDLSALNVLPGTITEMVAGEGGVVDLRLDCHGDALLARLTRYSVERMGLTVGAPIHAVVKSVALDRRDLGGVRADGADADTTEI